jgi:DNA-binding MarR family transcriptional regulator
MGLEEDIKQQRKFKSEHEKLLVNILYTNNWLSEHQAKVFKPFDVTSPQYNVLRILKGQFPNPCTVNLIIDRMLDRSSNASRIVDKLERKGLVERKTCPTDRRAKDVVITQKGLDLIVEIDAANAIWMKFFKNVSVADAEKANLVIDAIRKK